MKSLKALLFYLDQGRPFCADSRKAQTRSIYFALKGLRHDGHDFLKEARNKGAEVAVVSDDYKGKDFGLTLFFERDVLQTLQSLAGISRERNLKQKVIGITGSVGKTSTKEFLAALLKKEFVVEYTKNSENSQVSLPLTILNSNPKAQILILEMGMSVEGELKHLTKIAQPDIALITRIALSHADSFSNKEAIARAKGEILQSPRLKMVVMSENVSSYRPFRDYRGEKLIYKKEEMKEPLPLQFSADHLVENLYGAIKVAQYLGMSISEIRNQSMEIEPFTRRFSQLEKRGVLFIDDTYNANLDSSLAALKNLPNPKEESGKKIAVLGSMKELGNFSEECHKKVGESAKEKVDHLLTFGEEAKWIGEAFGRGSEHFSSKTELLERLKELAKKGDVVLVKGSNSLEMDSLLRDY
ncbi:MAG: UDP-N-acetylmuramoyl-tripeptide--D-alanyl-D-alanine ligase [Simkaniaceae bacterium]